MGFSRSRGGDNKQCKDYNGLYNSANNRKQYGQFAVSIEKKMGFKSAKKMQLFAWILRRTHIWIVVEFASQILRKAKS